MFAKDAVKAERSPPSKPSPIMGEGFDLRLTFAPRHSDGAESSVASQCLIVTRAKHVLSDAAGGVEGAGVQTDAVLDTGIRRREFD